MPPKPISAASVSATSSMSAAGNSKSARYHIVDLADTQFAGDTIVERPDGSIEEDRPYGTDPVRRIAVFLSADNWARTAQLYGDWSTVPEHASIVKNSRELLEYIGGAATVMAQYPGQSGWRPPIATFTAVPLAPKPDDVQRDDSGCVIDEVVRDNAPFAGYIITLSQCLVSDVDLVSAGSDSDGMSEKQSEQLMKRRVARDLPWITHHNQAKNQTSISSRVRGDKPAFGAAASMGEPDFFKTMTLQSYRLMCEAYQGRSFKHSHDCSGVTGSTALNPLNFFTIERALKLARCYVSQDGRRADPAYTNPAEWGVSDELPMNSFPKNGLGTQSVSPHQLHIGELRYVYRIQRSRRHIAMNDPILLAHAARLNEEDDSPEKRHQNLLDAYNEIIRQGFGEDSSPTIANLKISCTRRMDAAKRVTAPRKPGEKDDSHSARIRDYRVQHVATKEARRQCVDETRSTYKFGNKEISQPQQAISGYLEQALHEGKGSLKMPMGKAFRNLTSFAEYQSMKLLAVEDCFGAYVNHAAMLILECSLYMAATHEGLRLHVVMFGNTTSGKSHVMKDCFEKAIPGTAAWITDQSAKAEIVSNANRLNGLMRLYDELPADIAGVNAGAGGIKNGSKGDMYSDTCLVASNQAHSEKSTTLRSVMTQGVITYHRLEANPETKKFESTDIVVEAHVTIVGGINAMMADAASNMISRLLALTVNTKSRPDTSFIDKSLKPKTDSVRELREAYIRRCRRDQCLAAHILLYIQIGALEPIDSTAADGLCRMVLAECTRLGSSNKTDDPRHLERLRLAIYGFSLPYFIAQICDGELSVFKDDQFNLEDFVEHIGSRLVLTPEMAIFVMSLLKHMWEDAIGPAVIGALESYVLDGTRYARQPSMRHQQHKGRGGHHKPQQPRAIEDDPRLRWSPFESKPLIEYKHVESAASGGSHTVFSWDDSGAGHGRAVNLIERCEKLADILHSASDLSTKASAWRKHIVGLAKCKVRGEKGHIVEFTPYQPGIPPRFDERTYEETHAGQVEKMPTCRISNAYIKGQGASIICSAIESILTRYNGFQSGVVLYGNLMPDLPFIYAQYYNHPEGRTVLDDGKRVKPRSNLSYPNPHHQTRPMARLMSCFLSGSIARLTHASSSSSSLALSSPVEHMSVERALGRTKSTRPGPDIEERKAAREPLGPPAISTVSEWITEMTGEGAKIEQSATETAVMRAVHYQLHVGRKDIEYMRKTPCNPFTDITLLEACNNDLVDVKLRATTRSGTLQYPDDAIAAGTGDPRVYDDSSNPHASRYAAILRQVSSSVRVPFKSAPMGRLQRRLSTLSRSGGDGYESKEEKKDDDYDDGELDKEARDWYESYDSRGGGSQGNESGGGGSSPHLPPFEYGPVGGEGEGDDESKADEYDDVYADVAPRTPPPRRGGDAKRRESKAESQDREADELSVTGSRSLLSLSSLVTAPAPPPLPLKQPARPASSAPRKEFFTKPTDESPFTVKPAFFKSGKPRSSVPGVPVAATPVSGNKRPRQPSSSSSDPASIPSGLSLSSSAPAMPAPAAAAAAVPHPGKPAKKKSKDDSTAAIAAHSDPSI